MKIRHGRKDIYVVDCEFICFEINRTTMSPIMHAGKNTSYSNLDKQSPEWACLLVLVSQIRVF